MTFFHAKLTTKASGIHAQSQTTQIYLPVEAIAYLKFVNTSNYDVVVKDNWLPKGNFEVISIVATIQKHELTKLDIVIV